MKIVFKQMPLSFHKDAHLAAAASLAAHAQGKFWEYHDLLFANQKAIKRPDLERYAEQLGLNMQKFKKALDDKAFDSVIQRSIAEAQKVGARGTPTAFVNGYMVRGAAPYSQFKQLIDRELAKARGEAPPAPDEAPKLELLAPDKASISTRGAIRRGPKRARHTVVAFVDLQDVTTARLLERLDRLRKGRRDLAVVVKHFPVAIHAQAEPAARAALAAFAKDGDKAWRLMTTMSAAGRSLSGDRILELAGKVGLDRRAMAAALDGGKYASLVKADAAEARKLGVTAAPALFFDGRRYSGVKGYGEDALAGVLAQATK